jgi:hypothetical protein
MRARVPRDLSVVRLGKTDWRVSSAADPDVVLGYIERQRSGRFEVVWMGDPMRWGYAASFDEALAAFDDSSRFLGDVFAERATVVGREHAPVVSRVRRTSWVKSTGRSDVA